MSDLAEVKELFSKTEKSVADLRSQVEELEGKAKDVIDDDRLKKMQDDLAKKFSDEQEAMAKRLEAIETASNRPGPGATEQDKKHAEFFGNYLRKGNEPDEFKAMATSTQADGGFLVPDGMEAGIRKRQRRTSPVRMVANVVSFSGGSYDVLMERGDAGYEWAGEKQSRTETNTPTINRISIATHELSALPKVTQRMLDVATFDIEGWLTGYVADRFNRAEATAFVEGDGVDKPKGFLSYAKATDADDARAVETLQYRATGGSGDFAATNPADVLTQTFYDLQGAYQSGASWMMKNTTAARVATLKDGRGAYLIEGMMDGEGNYVRRIMGRPMYMADDMPAIGSNSYSIAVGDFSEGYTIVDGTNVVILRDPYTAKPFVLFYTTKRVGGGVTDFDAIKLIKFASS